MIKFRFILIILFFSCLNSGYSQPSAESEFKEIKKIYGNMKSISLNFENAENSSINGSLSAKRGNKFKVQFGDRIIRCDGQTIWNYSTTEKNVIVSNFDSHSDESSIETIFFSMLENNKPTTLRNITNTTDNKIYAIELVSTTDPNRKIELLYYSERKIITQVTLTNNYSTESWLISNLKINSEISDNTFVFETKDKIEIIDLR